MKKFFCFFSLIFLFLSSVNTSAFVPEKQSIDCKTACQDDIYPNIESESQDSPDFIYSLVLQYDDSYEDDEFLTRNNYESHLQKLKKHYERQNDFFMQESRADSYQKIYKAKYGPFIELQYSREDCFSQDLEKVKEKSLYPLTNLFAEKESYANDAAYRNQYSTYDNHEYGFKQALNDIGIFDSGFSGKGIKIGSIETGIPNTSINLTNTEYYTFGNYKTKHCSLTSSIYGGDFGIASNAAIYFASCKDNGYKKCMDWLIDNRVNVINQSATFGDDSEGKYTSKDAYADYIVYNSGVSIVVSAGNSTFVEAGALGENVISVASNDSNGGVSSFSSYKVAKNTDSKAKPTITAPGGGLVDLPNMNKICSNNNISGTSFSAPMVTGIIARLMEEFPSLKENPQGVISLLTASTTMVHNQVETFYEDAGFGLVNYAMARKKQSALITLNNSLEDKSSRVLKTEEVQLNYNVELSFNLFATLPSSQMGFSGTNSIISSPKISVFIQAYKSNSEMCIGTINTNFSFGKFQNTTHLSIHPAKNFFIIFKINEEWIDKIPINFSYLLSFKRGEKLSEQNKGLEIKLNEVVSFKEYEGFSGTIVIPNNIIRICQNAFSGCEKLEHVIFLPGSQLTAIESNAFGNCTNLKTFYLPSSVTKIENYPFLFSPNIQIVTNLKSEPLSGWSDYWNISYIDYDQMVIDIKNGVVKDESDYYSLAPVYWNERL